MGITFYNTKIVAPNANSISILFDQTTQNVEGLDPIVEIGKCVSNICEYVPKKSGANTIDILQICEQKIVADVGPTKTYLDPETTFKQVSLNTLYTYSKEEKKFIKASE